MSAGAVATAYVRLRPTSVGFQQEADAQIKGALTGAQKLTAAVIGVAGVAESVKLLAEAASEHQSAVALTERAVKDAGASWKVYGGTVETALDKTARASGISFQELYQGFIRLETQIKDTPKALHALALAEDVSRGRHIALGQAATALARASAGNIQSLSRLGIVIAKVSPITDELKGKLLDIKAVQEAQAEASAKQYVGTRKLSDAQLAISKLSGPQLKDLAAQTSAQLASAAAQDKQIAGSTALAEVQKRFGGQAAAYAKSTAGEYDRFKVSVEEAAAKLGTALLPTLSSAAQAAAKYADELGSSKGAAAGLAEGAHEIGSAVQAVVSIIKTSEPALRVFASLLGDVGGAGPVIAAYGAYKTLGLGISLATKAAVALGISTAADTTETAANTAARTLNTEATAASIPVYRSATGTFEVATVAERDLTVASKEARVALIGLTTVDLGALAIAAGAIYYLSTRADDGAKAIKRFHDTYAQLGTDKGNVAAQAGDVASLAKQYSDLAVQAKTAAALQAQIDGSFSEARDASKGAGYSVDIYVKALEDLKGKIGTSDPILAGQITRLENIATQADRLPSLKTIRLVLDDRSAIDNLDLAQAKVDELQRSAAGLGGELGKSILALGQPNGVFGPKVKIQPLGDPRELDKVFRAAGATFPKGAHELGKKTGQAFSTSFASSIDASTIGTAFRDAVTQAQAQLVSETGTLATTIGQALDAKLKAQTLPATREIAKLQAQITASQQGRTAADAAQAIADAEKKLGDLQRIYGPGALTADQAQQVAQAQLAVTDAQATATNDAKQRQITQLQTGVDAATKANDAAKAAASKRLADLSAELNDGLITQQTYVKRLNALLRGEGVNYKSTGKLLGIAVADGFRDGLSSVLAQAAALGGLGREQLAAAPRGTKAVNPAKAEADAIKAFLDSVAQTGGKFTVTGAGSLPPGVTLASLLAKAGTQRAASAYEVKQGAKADKGLTYAGETRDHTAQMVKELQKLNAKPPPVVVIDGKAKKRKTAEATRS